MDLMCPECGAALPAGGSCRDNFHALLALESEVPGGAGEMAHFYAVSAYALQHPDSMQLTTAALAGLRSAVAEALEGTAGIPQLRDRARRGAAGDVTRRAGDAVPSWPVNAWSETVRTVLAGGADGYAEHVEQWASSILRQIAAAESRKGKAAKR